nr:DapH/DapD/GlmU-related protein [Actinomyces trachealis]
MPDSAHHTPHHRWQTANIEGLDALLAALNAGKTISGNSAHHQAMHTASQEALRLTAELNGAYHSPEDIVELLSALTGQQVPASFRMFPPFTTDFGRNIRFGERVFLNSGCRFQDQGGIDIGDDALIGHNAVITTLNHDLNPARRADMHPAPVRIGRGAWLGANVTVLPGVTIADGAVVGAGSVVTKDVAPNTVVVGTPARPVRDIEP